MSPFVFAFLMSSPRIFGVAPTKTQNSVIAWECSEMPWPLTFSSRLSPRMMRPA